MSRLQKAAPALALAAILAAAVLFRVPVLLNSATVNSDTTIVGLQGWHLFDGERSLLLWGTGYQGVIEPLIAGLVMKLTPVKPAVGLVWSAVLGHLLLLAVLFELLRRRVGLFAGTVFTALLVGVPEPLNFITWAPPRQWAFFLLFASLWALDRASNSWRAILLGFFAAGTMTGLSLYSDLYVVLMVPGIAAAGLFACLSLGRRQGAVGGIAGLLGFAAGSIPRWAAKMHFPEGGVALRHFDRAWPLFWKECLPNALGIKIYPPLDGISRPLYEHGIFTGPLMVLGLFCFALLCGAGVWFALRHGRSRDLAACGAAWIAACCVAFIFSDRGQDLMSARYLVPIVLAGPLLFASLPVADRFRKPVLTAAALAALHFSVSGWVGYGGLLDGVLPHRAKWANLDEERALLAWLRDHDVQAGTGNYWICYRLAFLFKEAIPFDPATGGIGRYPPWADALKNAKVRTTVFDKFFNEHNDAKAFEAGLGAHPFERWEGSRFIAYVTRHDTPGYFFEATAETTSVTATEGEPLKIPVRVENTGTVRWSTNGFNLSYHLEDTQGRVLQADGARTAIPRTVEPYNSFEAGLTVAPLPPPGRYVLAVDLVEENITWFSQAGSTPLRIALEVVPRLTPPPPDR